MESITSIPVFSPRQQASIVAIGLSTVIVMGVAACVAIVLATLWAIVQLALLTLQSMMECMAAIGATYSAGDSLIRFLILASVAYGLYRVYRRAAERARP